MLSESLFLTNNRLFFPRGICPGDMHLADSKDNPRTQRGDKGILGRNTPSIYRFFEVQFKEVSFAVEFT